MVGDFLGEFDPVHNAAYKIALSVDFNRKHRTITVTDAERGHRGVRDSELPVAATSVGN
jgi:hypothetical protein